MPSDSLRSLRRLVSQVDALHPVIEEPLCLCLVLDANIVHAELRWRLANAGSLLAAPCTMPLTPVLSWRLRRPI
jgi:hypothetical protein